MDEQEKQEYAKSKKLYLKLDFAKTAYEKSAANYENTVKKFSALLIALSSLITAIAGLFTCYCICSPKNSVMNYILFAINCVLILATLFTDLHGYGLFERLKHCINDKPHDYFLSVRNLIAQENEAQDEINATKIIDAYIKTAKQIDEQTEKKKRILKIAMILTAITALIVLVTVIALLV